jgi:hypothetical protein
VSEIRPPATDAIRFALTSVGSIFLVGKQTIAVHERRRQRTGSPLPSEGSGSAGTLRTVTSNASKKPWDQRLTERWASQAKEATNDPTWHTASWRDQVKSPWYWAALPAMGLFFLLGGFRGVGAAFYVVAIALVQMSRRAARHKASS